jgi:prolipoprotein diacylglyceryltransferase
MGAGAQDKQQRLVRVGIRLAALGMVIGTLWWWLFFVRFSWTEEVQLSNGSVTTAYRQCRYYRFGVVGFHGPLVECTVELQTPRVSWRGDFFPAHIDVIGNSAILIGRLGNSYTCERYGRPNPPFVHFSKSERGWVRSMAPLVKHNTRANLAPMLPTRLGDAHHISLAMKDADFSLPGHSYQLIETTRIDSPDVCS